MWRFLIASLIIGIAACTPAIGRPIDGETPTPRPSPTATPTEIPPTPTVEPSPTAEVLMPPQIEGLFWGVNAEGQTTYYAEAENPYDLEEKEYAGETIIYQTSESAGGPLVEALGVVLTPEVVRVLMEEVNTPEAISAGNWQIPFPLDARGEENLRIEEVQDQDYWDPYQYRWLAVFGLSPNAVLTTPFQETQAQTIGYSPSFDAYVTEISIPFFNPERGWVVWYGFPEGSDTFISGYRESVSLGEPILSGITATLTGPKAPSGSQVVIVMGPSEPKLEDDEDIADNILEIGNSRVFLARMT